MSKRDLNTGRDVEAGQADALEIVFENMIADENISTVMFGDDEAEQPTREDKVAAMMNSIKSQVLPWR